MSITKTVKPYELLIRFKDGVFSGGHVKDIETIKDGSEVISERETDPRPIYSDSQEYEDLLESLNLSVMTENDNLKSENEALKSENESLKNDSEGDDWEGQNEK